MAAKENLRISMRCLCDLCALRGFNIIESGLTRQEADTPRASSKTIRQGNSRRRSICGYQTIRFGLGTAKNAKSAKTAA